jgi:hypothetical protein
MYTKPSYSGAKIATPVCILRWVGFSAGWHACAGCEKEAAYRHCEECEDDLCEGCFKASHSKGRKRLHPFHHLKEPLGPAERHCRVCQRRVGGAECPDCHQAFCDSCLAFDHAEAGACEVSAVRGLWV